VTREDLLDALQRLPAGTIIVMPAGDGDDGWSHVELWPERFLVRPQPRGPGRACDFRDARIGGPDTLPVAAIAPASSPPIASPLHGLQPAKRRRGRPRLYNIPYAEDPAVRDPTAVPEPKADAA
jgi:hypothetical protein